MAGYMKVMMMQKQIFSLNFRWNKEVAQKAKNVVEGVDEESTVQTIKYNGIKNR